MDSTTFGNALKDLYAERGKLLQLKDRPLLAYLSEMGKFGGDGLPLVAQYADPQNVSSSFTEAQGRADVGTTQVAKFLLTRQPFYNIVHIDRQLTLISESEMGAFFDAKSTEIDNAINAVSNRIAQAAYRSGWGDIGVVGSISGSTITLAHPANAYNFQPNMRVVFSSTLNSALLRGTSGSQYLQVVSASPSTGVVTFTAAVSTLTGGGGSVAANDTIFTSGDRQDSATPVMATIAGLSGWAPTAAPTSGDSWFGQDRSKSNLLQGVFYDGSGDAVEDALIKAASLMGEVGQTPTHCFLNFRQFAQLVKNQRIYERYEEQLTPTVGFTGIRIAGPNGLITVIPDRWAPSTSAFMVNRESVKLYYIGSDLVHMVEDEKGNPLIFRTNADGWEVRIAFYGNIGTTTPCAIANVKLALV